jgi:hypothetical protein
VGDTLSGGELVLERSGGICPHETAAGQDVVESRCKLAGDRRMKAAQVEERDAVAH